jgi:hypothetical protein
MAGMEGRSGKRTLSDVPEGLRLPRLGSSEMTVMRYLDAVAKAVLSDGLDPRTADTLAKIASTHLRAQRDRRSKERELEQYQQLNARLDALEQAAMAHEVATRQTARTGGDEAAEYDS